MLCVDRHPIRRIRNKAEGKTVVVGVVGGNGQIECLSFRDDLIGDLADDRWRIGDVDQKAGFDEEP